MGPDEHRSLASFLEAEDAGWDQLETLVASLSPEEAEVSGFLPGWSVKDALAHIAGWLAEAGHELGEIRAHAATDVEVDVDARNKIFVDANRDQPLPVVLFELRSARRRLLHFLRDLVEIPPAAEVSVRKAGPEHYAEHLPRLREWVAELHSKASPPG